MSYESGEEIYKVKNRRENEVQVKANRDNKVSLCWQKLDKKAKKLTFNFQLMDSQTIAGADTVEMLGQELQELQDKLDAVSRNVYLQQDIEKVHFEGIICCVNAISHHQLRLHANVDVNCQNDAGHRNMHGTSLLHHTVLPNQKGK